MLFTLTILLAILAFWGAGIFAGTLFLASGILSGIVIYISCKNKFNNQPSLLLHCFALLIAYIAITAIPLPSGMSGMLNSNRSEQNKTAQDAIIESVGLGLIEDSDAAYSLSRNRSGTIRILLLLICVATYSFLCSQLEQNAKLHFLQFIIALGAVMAAAGFISQWIIPQGKSIWWIFNVNHGQPVGCFINRNHFGGFLAIIAPTALTYAVHEWKNNKQLKSLLHVAAFLLISFAVISSLSRGAWVAWLSAMLITTAILAKISKSHRIITALLCITAIAFATILGLKSSENVSDRLATFERIAETPSANMRFTTWNDALKIIPDYALLGTGANGFRMIFPQYRTESSRKEFKHIENEFIQIPLETGLIGVFLFSILLILFFVRWNKMHHSDSDDQNLVATCMLGALSAAAVHALFDFSIRVPLYAITLAGISGLAIEPLKTYRDNANAKKPLLIYSIASLMLICIIFLSGGTKMTERDSSDYIKTASAEELCRSLAYSPTSWQIWYHLGNKSIASGLPGSYEFGEKCINQAVEYDPLNYRLRKQLCLVRLHNNDIPGAKKAYEKLKSLRSWVKINELE